MISTSREYQESPRGLRDFAPIDVRWPSLSSIMGGKSGTLTYRGMSESLEAVRRNLLAQWSPPRCEHASSGGSERRVLKNVSCGFE